MEPRIAPELFSLDPQIRYVAVNRAGAIVEMEQAAGWPTANSHETDRMEELIVNPVVLEAVRRRGKIDLDGVRHVTIRYGALYTVVFPIEDGHVSVGVELSADVERIAEKVERALPAPGRPTAPGPVERALRLAFPRGVQ
jgi:hypothetical protein